ncbi:polyunsaturated fatty acid 5-lipoxygenase-like [Pseudorasbora parva]|uniref:polyunsaturated fatty acid 5-lipoxygenase-like n=1 Tax=Pseudorasbora parva TaxID=51549 RepID=UPI00351DABBD
MLTYKVCVSAGRQMIAETTNSIYLTLIDSENYSSERTLVNQPGDFAGFERKDIGDIVEVKLEKEYPLNSLWFCKNITVKTPSGKCFEFPCHRWIEDENEVIIREGTARLPQDDTGLLKKQRRNELESRRKIFRWKEWRPGFPKGIDAKMNELPSEVQFDAEKMSDFALNSKKAIGELFLDKNKDFINSWKDMADFEKILEYFKIKNTVLETVSQDWNKDYMFGYQFLNGCNPVMIRKCVNLPNSFPVTHEMVEGFLKRGVTLQQELKAGNIYIADYKILDGLPTSSPQLYLAAPICLLYKNRLDQIVPIAIQLSQNPGERSPIFLPSDNEYDWTFAKMWVKSADFLVHQLVTHLLKTHLISEVFEMAMYRQLSEVHPVYKLLKPHVRFTIAINVSARENLIGENGVFSKFSSVSGAGIEKMMESAMKTLTYKSLCFPEAIKARRMEDVPKYYYRDDGMKIWNAIHCFVSAVVNIYYDSDEAIQKDVEIQEFVKDVFFGMENSDNFPKSLNTRAQLSEYLTVVIFTSSAQHAAVNFGQFDWYAWIPNSPCTMRKPPPEQKGQVDMKYIMESLPSRGCCNVVLATVWTLSQFQKNELFLGMYPETFFTEQPVKEAIKTFLKKLDEVTNKIKRRNEGLTMEYCYLSPDKIPNSVAI